MLILKNEMKMDILTFDQSIHNKDEFLTYGVLSDKYLSDVT